MARMGVCSHSRHGASLTRQCPVSCMLCHPEQLHAGLSPSTPPGPDPTIHRPAAPVASAKPSYQGICAQAPSAGSGQAIQTRLSLAEAAASLPARATCSRITSASAATRSTARASVVSVRFPVASAPGASGYQGNCAEPTSAGSRALWGGDVVVVNALGTARPGAHARCSPRWARARTPTWGRGIISICPSHAARAALAAPPPRRLSPPRPCRAPAAAA